MEVKLLKRIEHNGKTYDVGTIESFDDKDAKAMISRKWAVESKSKKAARTAAAATTNTSNTEETSNG